MAVTSRTPFSALANTVANTAISAYTVSSTATYAVVTVTCVNTNTTAANVTIGISPDAALDTIDYVQYNTTLSIQGEGIQRSQMLCRPGETIFVLSDSDNVNIRVSGVEYVADNINLTVSTLILSNTGVNTIYTAPTTSVAEIIDINILNTSATADAKFNVAITSAATPSVANGDYVEYQNTATVNGGYRTIQCGVVKPGENIILETDTANAVVARLTAFEVLS